jgi:hypothetical protein
VALGTAAALAVSLTAAQLLPAIEFMQLTTRSAASGLSGIYHCSVEPYRLVKLVWANFGGSEFGENTHWPELIRMPGVYPTNWVLSLYLGGMTTVLGLGRLTVQQGPP